MKLELTWQQTVVIVVIFLVVGGAVYFDKAHGDTLLALAMGILLPSPIRASGKGAKVLPPSENPQS